MAFPYQTTISALLGKGLVLIIAGVSAMTVRAADDMETPATVFQVLESPGVQNALYDHFNGERYGFLLMNSGVVLALHDADGNILVDRIGDWVLQRAVTNEEGKVAHSHAGMLREPTTETVIEQSEVDGKRQFRVTSEQRRVRQILTITCEETGPELEYEWEVIDFDAGGEGTIGLAFNLPLNITNVNTDLQPGVTQNPAVYETRSGEFLMIGFNADGYAPYGNHGLSVYRPGAKSLGFYPRFGGNRDPGSQDSLTLTITIP